MPGIPRDDRFDSTLALARDPYRYISEQTRRRGADLIEMRFLLQPTIAMSGPAAARMFYESPHLIRKGAMPGRVRKTLLGEGGVQGLDGREHRHRKLMFMDLMSRQSIEELTRETHTALRAAATHWATMDRVTLYGEVCDVLTIAVCEWAGLRLAAEEVKPVAHSLTLMFDAAGAIGPRHWEARRARASAEAWLASVVRDIRARRFGSTGRTPVEVVALHRNAEGRPLDARVAAVEILNLLRPTVAVSVYFVMLAHALHVHKASATRIAGGDAAYTEWFVQEVRRWYPFFPAVAARVSRSFLWRGYHFPKGRRVMLDLFGTNHDGRTWRDPEIFRPERFEAWRGDAFAFIPQGGGDHYANHRCAGEWMTITLMKVFAEFMTRELAYTVPPQDLRLDWGRMPALPCSRFVMTDVSLRAARETLEL